MSNSSRTDSVHKGLETKIEEQGYSEFGVMEWVKISNACACAVNVSTDLARLVS